MRATWWQDDAAAFDGGAAPSPPSPFVGRRKQLTDGEAALVQGARIALVGSAPGAGAGAMAWELVRRRRMFPGGVCWWSLRTDGPHWHAALRRWDPSLPDGATPEALEAFCASLAGREATLFALDGVGAEHLAMVKLLAGSVPPSAAILLTSRMPVQGFLATSVGGLALVDGLALLRKECGASLPQNEAVALVEAADGMPLALALVGRRYRRDPASQAALLLEPPDPSRIDGVDPAALRGNAAAVAAFLALLGDLPPRARRTLRAASVLRGGTIREPHAAAVALLSPRDLRADLEDAQLRGILEAGADDGTWRIHPQLRDWLGELARLTGEQREIEQRHAEHFLRLAARPDDAPPTGSGPLGSMLADVLAALERAGDNPLAEEVLRQGHGDEGWLTRLGVAPRATAPAVPTRAPRPTPVADPAAVRRRLKDALEQATTLSLAADDAAAQAAVWVDGARADAGPASTPVAAALDALADAGRRADAEARAAADAVERMLEATSVEELDELLLRIAAHVTAAEAASADAEARWQDVEAARRDERAALQQRDAARRAARREAAALTQILDATRERIREAHLALPDPQPAPVAEVWGGVSRALSAAMSAAREADAEAEANAPRLPEVTRLREAGEAACQEALTAALEAERLAQMQASHREAIEEVQGHTRRAVESAARFRALRDRIRVLLADADTPEVRDLTWRLDEMSRVSDESLDALARAGEGVRRAADDAERRRLQREAGRAAQRVASQAVDGLTLLQEVEALGDSLQHLQDERALARLHDRARDRLTDVESRATQATSHAGSLQVPAVQVAAAAAAAGADRARAALHGVLSLRDRVAAAEALTGALGEAAAADELFAALAYTADKHGADKLGADKLGAERAARDEAERVRLRATLAEHVAAAEASAAQAAHSADEVEARLEHIDDDAADALRRQATDARDRAAFAARMPAAGDSLDDLRRAVAAAEARARDAGDAARVAATAAAHAPSVHEAWIVERRRATETLDRLGDRLDALRDDIAALRGALSSELSGLPTPPPPGVHELLAAAEARLEASDAAATDADRGLRDLDPQASLSTFAAALNRTESALRSGADEVSAARGQLTAARETWARLQRERTEALALADRLPAIEEQAQGMLRAAERAVEEKLAALPPVFAADDDPTDAVRAELRAGRERLAELSRRVEVARGSDRLDVVQSALADGDRAVVAIADHAERARDLARLAADRARAEARRLQQLRGERAERARHALDGAGERGVASATAAVASWDGLLAAVPEIEADLPELADRVQLARDRATTAANAIGVLQDEAADTDDPDLLQPLASRAAALADEARAAHDEAATVASEARATWSARDRARLDSLAEALRAALPSPPVVPEDVERWGLLGIASRRAWERDRAGLRGVSAVASALADWLADPGRTSRDLDAGAASDAALAALADAASADAESLGAWVAESRTDADAFARTLDDRRDQHRGERSAAVALAEQALDGLAATSAEELPDVVTGPLAAARDALQALRSDPSPDLATPPTTRPLALQRATELQEASDALADRVRAAAEAREALQVAILASRAERRGRVGAALDACRALTEEAASELHGDLRLAESDSAELTDHDAVAAALETLRRLAQDAVAAEETVVGRGLLMSADPDPDSAFAALLDVASATGAALRARLLGSKAAAALDMAVAAATRSEIEACRGHVLAVADQLARLDADHARARQQAAAQMDRWPAHPATLAAARATAGAADLLLQQSSRAAELATAVQRTASLRQARGFGLQADVLVAVSEEQREALLRASERAAQEEQEARVQALEEAKTQAAAMCGAIEAHDAAAWQRADEAVQQALGWTLAPVATGIGHTLAPTPHLARLVQRSGPLRAAVDAAVDPDAARRLVAALAALAHEAQALHGRVRTAADALAAELDLRLPELLDGHVEAARDALRAVDPDVARAVAARLDGEARVEALVGPGVASARTALVAQATATQSALAAGSAIIDRLRQAPDGVAARALLDDALDAAERTRGIAASTLQARAVLEAAALAQEEVDATRARVVAALRERIEVHQIAYDEVELTIEASREGLAGAPVEIADQWSAVLAGAAEAAREMTRSRQALRRAMASLTAEDLEDARTEAEEALAGAARRTDEVRVAIPEVLGTQIQHAWAARTLIESRVRARQAASRCDRLARDLAMSASQALAALADAPSLRTEWQVANAALDALGEQSVRVAALRQAAEESHDPHEADDLARQAEGHLPEAEALWQAGKRAASVLQRAAASVSARRRAAARVHHDGLRARAARVLGVRAPIAAWLLRWSRAATRWATPWSDDTEVTAALAAAERAAATARDIDQKVLVAADRALRAASAALCEAQLLEAEAGLTELESAADVARDAFGALGQAVQDAWRNASARRDAGLRRQEEAAQAATRLRTGLGARSPAQRIPLFERGLTVARLRGDRHALHGWLLDTAELYDESGRPHDARRLLDEAVSLAGSLGEDRVVRARLARARHLHASGDPAAALDDLRVALDLTDDAAPIADDLHGELGLALLGLGDEDGARAELELAAELAHVAGDVRSTGLHLGRLARLASAAGDLDEAEHHANAAAEAMHAAGDAVGLAAELGRRADILRRLGRVAEAVQVAEEALDVAAHDEGLTATLRAVLGWCWLSAGQPARAHAEFTAAAAIATGRADGAARAHARAGQAACARAQATGGPTLTPGLAWAASKETRRRARRTDRLGLDRSRPLPDQLAVAADAWADAAEQALSIGDLPAAALRRVHEAEARAALGDPAARATAEAALGLLARLPRANAALESAARRVSAGAVGE